MRFGIVILAMAAALGCNEQRSSPAPILGGQKTAMNDIEPASQRFIGHPLGVQVHSILWNEWDPIGVNGMFDRLVEVDPDTGQELGPAPDDIRNRQWPDDEYDWYVWDILGMLDKGATEEALGQYLDVTTTERIGLTPPDLEAMRTKHRALARKILAMQLSNRN